MKSKPKKDEGLNYETPLVEVMEVEVEKGFATSGSINDVPMHGAKSTDFSNDYNF